MNAWEHLLNGDAVSISVAVTLLCMSVASWVTIVWKALLIKRCSSGLTRAIAAFWQAADLQQAQVQLQAFDHEQLALPLLQAALKKPVNNVAASADAAQQLTRVLRDALHLVLQRLQAGQVLLATVGSTAPFVGLLGTVWGIYHALDGIAGAGQVSIEKISGPVGEALVMTAAGLAVAIPAVLGYNVLGRFIAGIEATLEGFARDIRSLFLDANADAAWRQESSNTH